MKSNGFVRKWVMANTAVMFVAYLLYTPIAHGITGGHGREMTPDQIISHCVALAVVAGLLFAAQRSVLNPYIHISPARMAIGIVAFIGLFWFGYYQDILPNGPDYDILFGYLALGSAMWIGAPLRRKPALFILALLSFPFASFIGELIFFLVVTISGVTLDMQTGMVHHTLFWLTVGTATGSIGGWLSGIALKRMLNTPKM